MTGASVVPEGLHGMTPSAIRDEVHASKIAILHTSLVFVTVETGINDLIQELIPGADAIHLIDSDLLVTVIREHGISSKSEQRMTHLAQAAESAGADIIFSLCSSLGPALDVAARLVSIPVVKIDEAMALEAARRATRIGVLATVPTTLGPTSDLIGAKAEAVGRRVDVEQRLCGGAFALLGSGDRDAHDAMVVAEALDLAKGVDLIVLAQASMARIAPVVLEKTGVVVLASPRAGVAEPPRRLTELHARTHPDRA